MNRIFLLIALFMAPSVAWAEGRCPPGQYPIGDDRQGVGGCAPIPGGPGQGSGQVSAPPVPTGEWETRWGAIAQDASPAPGAMLAIGVSESRASKGEAASIALSQCGKGGGVNCKILMEYHNQCVALAGPEVSEYRLRGGATYSSRAPSEAEAKLNSIRECRAGGKVTSCQLIYSACSMSEFKSFR